ncbi:MAG: Rap1a/Tai family immunity protein [Parvibaculum sp.]
MYWSKVARSRARLRPVALIFCIFLLAPLAGGPADARMRIETGRDLHTACAVLAEHALNPEKPTPPQARYCRQYISGYFESLRHLHRDDAGAGVYAPAGQDPYACITLDGPRSYDQLARQIVHTGDWNPKLLDGDAIALMRKAFSDNPPC